MKTITLSDDILLSQVADLLVNGRSVVLPVKGMSMLPFIVGGKDSIELHPPTTVKRGDIVLGHTIGGNFVLHRVIKEKDPEVFVLQGDGNLQAQELCHRKGIIGVARAIIGPKGKRRPLDSYRMKLSGFLWMHLRPIRRILLKTYNICIK